MSTQASKPDPDYNSLIPSGGPPMSTCTDLALQTNKLEPNKTSLSVAQIPPTSTNTDIQPESRPVRLDLPKGFDNVWQLYKPVVDEALQRVHLARNYINAKINSMVKQKIADGELSSEASIKCQKYCIAECTLKYWASEYPRFTRPTEVVGSFRKLLPAPIKLSDFTIDYLLILIVDIAAPEIMEDLRPLVVRDFEDGCFQPAKKSIKRSYTGVASFVFVYQCYRPGTFEAEPRMDYYTISIEVKHKVQDGVPIVKFKATANWTQNVIVLDKMGHEMQQFVDAANGVIQDLPDDLLLTAPNQEQSLTIATSNSAMVPQTLTDRSGADDNPLTASGVLLTSNTTASIPQTNYPEPHTTVQLARTPAPRTRPELNEAVVKEDGITPIVGSASGHSMDNSNLNPTKNPARNTEELQKATKCAGHTRTSHIGRSRSFGRNSKEIVQTEPKDMAMQDNFDTERLNHVGPEQKNHDKERSPRKKLKSVKSSQFEGATR
ncbi:hypothetical protein BGX38DRAFT_1138931 [Terfezia claveryi]|nr:hypothetical protein BGX38DRAFT_1138931 [Terfezia claveryi]